MKTSPFSLIPLAVLAFAWPAMAQTPTETILPAIIPSSQTHVKAQSAPTTPSAGTPAPVTSPVTAAVHTRGVVVNPTPTRPAVTPPHATVFSENSTPRRDQTVSYYVPVGAVSPRSGLRTYPGHTAATITNGATRASSGGIPGGSTVARPAGSNGRPSTKAPTVRTR
jgi:hypothetical protein